MIRIAFASEDRLHVNLHFGGGERFVLYDVRPGEADLVGVGEFVKAVRKGVNAGKGGVSPAAPPGRAVPVRAVDESGPPVDKVAIKIDFLRGCAAVYAASIGASAIKRLLAAGIQPIIVDNGHDIEDLLNEVSLALCQGGLSWVTRAKERAEAADLAPAKTDGGASRRLITSIDDLD